MTQSKLGRTQIAEHLCTEGQHGGTRGTKRGRSHCPGPVHCVGSYFVVYPPSINQEERVCKENRLLISLDLLLKNFSLFWFMEDSL